MNDTMEIWISELKPMPKGREMYKNIQFDYTIIM